jgi:hypothetical protein
MSGSLITNTFRIPLFDNLSVPYRWVRFDDLPLDDEEYDGNVQHLATIIGRQLKAPAAPVWRDREHLLAVAIGKGDVPDKVNLCGAVAKLHVEKNVQTLRLRGGNELEQDIAKKFIRWELRNSFYRDCRFWEHYGRQTEREPIPLNEDLGRVAIYRTFGYGIVPSVEGDLEFSVDVGFCYLSRLSLQVALTLEELSTLKFERCLYKYGLDWYPVEVSSPTRRLREIEIPNKSGGELVSLTTFIRNEWPGKHLPLVERLSDEDFALHYKNSEKKTRWAAAPLLYQIYSTEDVEAAGIHHRSILAPYVRRHEIENIIRNVFSGRKVFGNGLVIDTTMRRIPNLKLKLPRLIFGNDTEVSLNKDNLRTVKWDALRAPGVGPYVRTPFDPQFMNLPVSLPPPVAADFATKVRRELQNIYPEPYEPEILVYDDSSRKLSGQLQSIDQAMGERCGYLLQVLPKYPHPKLYRLLKRKQSDRKIYSQCARSSTILSFYVERSSGEWVVKTSRSRDYASYIRHLSLGILAVNRKWLWRLADGTLHNPGYIGIDVYKGTAVFTFAYLDGKDMYFWIARSSKEEKLSREMVYKVLIDRLPKDFARLGLHPSSIVVFRDGKLCTPDRLGLEDVAAKLKHDNVVPGDFEFSVVEVHKNSAYQPRIFWEQQGKTFNPDMGSYREIGTKEAILCTTGNPLLTQGTAEPVHLIVVAGRMTILEAIEDFYAFSHLGFTSPRACHRLAFPLALADQILRERRPERPEEQPWDDDESEEKPVNLDDHQRRAPL